jgi:hypothetical protein
LLQGHIPLDKVYKMAKDPLVEARKTRAFLESQRRVDFKPAVAIDKFTELRDEIQDLIQQLGDDELGLVNVRRYVFDVGTGSTIAESSTGHIARQDH